MPRCRVQGCSAHADYEVILYDVDETGDVAFYRDSTCPYLCANHVVENEEKAQGVRRPRGRVHYPYTNRHAGTGFTIYRPLDEADYADQVAGPLRQTIDEVCELAAARRTFVSIHGCPSGPAGKVSDTWLPPQRDLREYLEKLPATALYALQATALLGSRLWQQLPDLKEVYLHLSARLQRHQVVAALLDEEDLGKHLAQGLAALKEAGAEPDSVLR